MRNHLRSMLAEHSHANAKGTASLKELVEDFSSVEKVAQLDGIVQRVMTSLKVMLKTLAEQIEQLGFLEVPCCIDK